MSRGRTIAGLVAAAILLLSSAAHSLLGWPGIRAQLESANARADLVKGMQVGWLFGGVSMLAFGVIALIIFTRRLRGASVSTTPALVAGVAYLAFGAWALAANDFAPFYFIFVVPAVLLLVASTGKETAHGAS